jgi:hypothetical protein
LAAITGFYPREGLLVKELFSDEFWLVAHADGAALKLSAGTSNNCQN